MSHDFMSVWVEAGAQVHSPSSCSSRPESPRATPPGGKGDLATAPLGSTWEITAPPLLDPLPDSSPDLILRRIERFHLQAISRELLYDLKDSKHREFAIKRCLICRQEGKEHVGVHRRDGKGFYTNLQTCGSVWICPVCAAKISEARCQELEKGIATWRQMGGEVIHVIYTGPHHRGQSLEEFGNGMGRSRGFMLHRKPWKKKIKPSLEGSVLSREITRAGMGVDHGWHVHYHELLFVKPLNFMEWLGFHNALGELWMMWRDACLTAGIGDPDPYHGVKVKTGSHDFLSKYAAKWGLGREMTKGHIKKAREGFTPFSMLSMHRDGDSSYPWKAWFREYALWSKGKHQLEYSRGLKDRLGLEDVSDEEIAARKEPGEELGLLDLDTWRLVRKANKRGELLAIAGASGWEGVVSFIRGLQERVCK